MSKLIYIIFLLSTWLSPRPVLLQSEEAVVQAVLFYSTTCGHCQYVITEVLPPLFEKYGDRLQLMGIDVGKAGAGDLYQAALEKFNVDSGGVPALVVGDHLLIGSKDIPDEFPGLIEEYLAQGGADWPDIPGLAEAISAAEAAQAATATAAIQAQPGAASALPAEATSATAPLAAFTPTPTAVSIVLSSHSNSGVWERFALDPWGNTLAIIVLAGMLMSVVAIFYNIPGGPRRVQVPAPAWLVPLLCIVGLGVAGYLAYVETNQVSAYCGPVGDCNAVQQSEYARLFGWLPIGVLGLLGYVLIGITWAISRVEKDQLANLASLALFLMSLFGVLFSIYLTFLEPFVIGATCAWCLTSAILMTGMMWLTARRGIQAWNQLQGKALPHRAS